MPRASFLSVVMIGGETQSQPLTTGAEARSFIASSWLSADPTAPSVGGVSHWRGQRQVHPGSDRVQKLLLARSLVRVPSIYAIGKPINNRHHPV